MELLGWALFCAVCLLPVLALRKQAPEQALLLTLAVAAVALSRVLALIAPALSQVEALFARAGVDGDYVVVLLRTVAAALLIVLPLLEAVAGLLLGYFAWE